jgi:hypothetical protein
VTKGASLGEEPFFWFSVPRPTLGKSQDEPDIEGTEDNMMERLLALLLAGALVAPQVGRATESALNYDGARQTTSKFPEKLPLPPIPYLDTMPWMNFVSEANGAGIGTLLSPHFNVPEIPKNSAFVHNGPWNAEPNPSRTATR